MPFVASIVFVSRVTFALRQEGDPSNYRDGRKGEPLYGVAHVRTFIQFRRLESDGELRLVSVWENLHDDRQYRIRKLGAQPTAVHLIPHAVKPTVDRRFPVIFGKRRDES